MQMIKESVHQEDIIIVNIYALNIEALKYTKQILREQYNDSGGLQYSIFDNR